MQAEALHASLFEQVQLLADTGQWRRFLDFTRSFHTYSLNNLLLILAQNPDMTMVAGFRQWQAKGRQVRKGEAESVAYVDAGLAGFDMGGYSVGYITGWANENVQQIRDTASRVLHAVHAITNLICA